jgi:putative ABC transport system substrate-binding protein
VRRFRIGNFGLRIGRGTVGIILAASALAAPLSARAQQPERIRRIGVLHYLQENDLEGRRYVAAFQRALQESGWIVDRNVHIDYRWTGGDANLIRKYADDLVALAPDVILAAGGSHVGPLQQVTRTIPIVFVQVADAVVAASSTVWRDRAATPPGSRILSSTSA